MPHLDRSSLPLALAALALFAAACGNGDACVFDNDCPFGDRCSSDGLCVPLGGGDAGEPGDAGESEDAGPARADAGPRDAGPPPDAGPDEDGGPFDGGPPQDAGPEGDAGPPVDAGPANCPSAAGVFRICDMGGALLCPAPVCYGEDYRVIADGSAACRFMVSAVGDSPAVTGTFDVMADGSFDASGLTLSSGASGCTGQVGATITLTCTSGCGQEWTNIL